MRKSLKRTSSILLAALMIFLMATPVLAITNDWYICPVGPNEIEIAVDEEAMLPYQVIGDNGEDVTTDATATVTWEVVESYDQDDQAAAGIVSLDANGKVRGLMEGHAIIVGTLSNGSFVNFNVIVGSQGGSDPQPGPGPGPGPMVEAEELYFLDQPDNAQSYSVPLATVGVSIRNYINTVPAEANYDIANVEIVSSNPDVIDRDPNKPDGLQVKSAGKATITITYKGKSDSREFTVTEGGMMFESFGPEGNNQVTFSDAVSAENQEQLGSFLRFASLLMGIDQEIVKQGLIDSGVDISKQVAYVSFRIHVSKCEENATTGEVLLSMDITPQYRFTQGEGEMTEFNISGPFEMKIPIRETFFKKPPMIQHKHEGKVYTYQGSFDFDPKRNTHYVKFTNEHGFSEFTVGAVADEKTTPAATDKVPQTGDHNNVTGWIVLMAAAVVIGSGTVIYTRKRKTSK